MYTMTLKGAENIPQLDRQQSRPAAVVRAATLDDIDACKTIAEQHRTALGFLTRAVFADASDRGHLLVAESGDGQVVGFVRFNHRRQGAETAVYDIAVAHEA